MSAIAHRNAFSPFDRLRDRREGLLLPLFGLPLLLGERWTPGNETQGVGGSKGGQASSRSASAAIFSSVAAISSGPDANDGKSRIRRPTPRRS